jgi:hypothetical protein
VSWWSGGAADGGNVHSYLFLVTSPTFYYYSSPEKSGSECSRHGRFLS